MKESFKTNKVIFDYVAIRFRGKTPREVFQLLCMSDFTLANFEMCKGFYSYDHRFYYGGIHIHYMQRPDDFYGEPDEEELERIEKMGVLLEMSGQGCRTYETYGRGNFEGLLGMCVDDPENNHLTRLDVAYDDFSGVLDLARIQEDIRNGEYVSKARKWQIVDGSDGKSAYIGSKQSNMLLRIYDKAAERQLDDGTHWIRVEMQMRDENCLGFARVLENLSLGQAFSGVLSNYLRFVDPSETDSTRWRWPIKEYWLELINGIHSISIAEKPGVEYNVLNVTDFVVNHVGNAIDCIIKVYGAVRFIEMLKARTCKPNPKYKKIVDDCAAMGMTAKIQFESWDPDTPFDEYFIPYLPEDYLDPKKSVE